MGPALLVPVLLCALHRGRPHPNRPRLHHQPTQPQPRPRTTPDGLGPSLTEGACALNLVKRQRKTERRKARGRKSASRSNGRQHTDVGESARRLADPNPLQLSDVITMLRANMRGPGEEAAYDYCADDHGWFVVPRAGETFELPLTAELQSNWELLAEEDPRCAPLAERIRELRGGGRTHVTATLTDVFWEALLPDESTIRLEPATDDEPASVSCPELSDETIGFWASELGFDRFDGEVALPAYSWMSSEDQLHVALARRVGQRWTDAYQVRLYRGADTEYASIPPEVCPPRQS